MSPIQQKKFEQDGYCIIRQGIPREEAIEVRGIIRNILLTPDTKGDHDPMDPMGNDPRAAAARFRKLAGLAEKVPLIWNVIYASPVIRSLASGFLGEDLLMKFNSCFLKPARTGSATPWHQDNGLWRDGELEPFNFWVALDPATKANGCLQFIPGSHRTEIVPHVLYEDSIHAELPREQVAAQLAAHGVHHIELETGDFVFWHSSLWHYSPVNTSERGRIGIAGVYSNPEIAGKSKYFHKYLWVQKEGNACYSVPPEIFVVESGSQEEAPPYERRSAKEAA